MPEIEYNNRRLSALHPALYANNSTGTWSNLNGWSIVSPTVLFHETEIDLSGYAMDSLTYFPEAVGLQDPGVVTFKPGATSAYSAVVVLDIITSVPMDIADVASKVTTFGAAPSMSQTAQDWSTILFGQYRFYTTNTFITYPDYMQLETSGRFDSGEPTAADKLYSYRIVITIATDLDPNSVIVVPAARHILNGYMDNESDLIYMQRLKRSYELANQK